MPAFVPSPRTASSPGHPTHAVDRAFLSMGRRHPDVRWDAGGIAYLSGPPPSLSDLRAYVEYRLGELPLLTSRVEGGPRRPRWLPDPDFAVGRHVHEVVAEGPGGWDTALHTALNAPFGPGAYWGVWLIHGHAADEYAVCHRFHHACQDGSAAAATFRTMLGGGEFSARPSPGEDRPALPRRVGTAAGLGAAFAAAALAVRGRRPDVPFLPSGERRLWRGRVAADTLRRIGSARGGSAHDAHLAALAGALSAWSDRSGVALPRVTALVPFDARRPDEEQTWGNRCFALPLELPVGASRARGGAAARVGDSPRRRLDHVMAETRKLRAPARRQAIQDLVRWMPDRPTEWYLRRMLSPRVTDVMATSMPIADKAGLGETPVTGVNLLPLLVPGHLFGVGLSFFGEWADVSFVTDRALPSGELFPELWERAVGELEDAFAPV
ncbi:wax ester/triacylglycerol synthase domain-containing protein [Streptomyces sp. NPDC087512]|uniref:wax ester/triacylglycerol synthase domain-containing protein n=1 Tax=Streptomyces sp. NPDC087512 TaxID=3155059 RepID=UPI00343C45F7